MAEGSGRVSSASLLLAIVVLAASAATCLCVPLAAAPVNVVATARADRGTTLASSSRFLATAAVTRKTAGACREGDPAGMCAGHLRCCGGACADVLASLSNYGACGRRCPFGRLCCAGRCVAVAHDDKNCGACGRACAAGVTCAYGMCGYAY